MASRKKTRKGSRRKATTGSLETAAATDAGAATAATAPARRKSPARKRTRKTRRAGERTPRQVRTGRHSTAVIFEALAAVLAPYLHLFEAEMHPRMGYCLKTWGEWPTEVYFAGVQWSEEGLHFHLFPLQKHPNLIDGVSEELRRHRQGTISFRFDTFEPELFAELAAMTSVAFDTLRADGVFPSVAA